MTEHAPCKAPRERTLVVRRLTDPFVTLADAREACSLPLLVPDLFAESLAPFDPVLSPEMFLGAPPAAGREREQDRLELDPELPHVGSIIGKYRLEALLGVGGFAAVYRATHLLLLTSVAIKVPLPRLLRKNPELADSLCREARYAARISHPNVVQIFDVTHTPELTFLVMEYIGETAFSRAIAREAWPAIEVLRVGLQVIAGLRAGLEQGLVHRDVKPSNIMLTELGKVKLVDFGLAAHGAAVTRDGDGRVAPVLVGTYGYMAPEVAAGRAFDFRSDVYSLGVTLFQAATGRLPFDNRDPEVCLRRQREESPPHPRALRADLPAELCDLLLWMLRREPEARPQSYAELEAAMQGALSRGADSRRPGQA